MKASNLRRITRAIGNVIRRYAAEAASIREGEAVDPPCERAPEGASKAGTNTPPSPSELTTAHLVTILRNPHYLEDRKVYAKCGVCNRATPIPYAELGDRAEGWAADDLTSCTGVVHVVDGASGGRS